MRLLSPLLCLAPLLFGIGCGMPPIPAPIGGPSPESRPARGTGNSRESRPEGDDCHEGCGGEGDSRQTPEGPSAEEPEPPEPPEDAALPLPEFRPRLALGGAHSCALLAPDKLWCWGADHHGQLQGHVHGRQARSPDPRRLELPAPLRSVESGTHHLCAITTEGDVWCWGNNSHGQLHPDGVLEGEDQSSPIHTGLRAVALALGDAHSCALLPSGRLRCWGRNLFGERGVFNEEHRFTALAAGGASNCARARNTGRWHCWGSNLDGQLGSPPTGSGFSASPVPLPLGANTVAGDTVAGDTVAGDTVAGDTGNSSAPVDANTLNLGWGHGCSIDEHQLRCWGRNDSYQSAPRQGGDAESLTAPLPLPLPEGLEDGPVVAALGARHTCLGTPTQSFCRGLNHRGQLGDRSSRLRRNWRPVAFPGETPRLLTVAAGVQHTCSLHEGLEVHCWGGNREGQLGLGHRRAQRRPRRVSGLGDREPSESRRPSTGPWP